MAKKPKQGSEDDIEAPAAEQASGDAATDAVFAEGAFTAANLNSKSSSARLPTLLGLIAVGIAAIALAGFFYLAFTTGGGESADDGNAAYLATLSNSVNETAATLREMQARLAELAKENGASAADTVALERRFETRLSSLEPVAERILRLERSFSALQGISTGVQDTWLLAETEYYMQIANAQLQLAGNPHLATLALRLADERLAQLANPALTDVRRVLSDELQALEIIEKPDIEGATLTLASLAGLVDSLPLRQEIRLSRANTGPPNAELSGIDRAVASLQGAVEGLVKIRRTDESVRPLIAPDAIYFLRTNLALQLQVARLALLRGEQAVFRQSLDDAEAWIEEYYDVQSTPVRSALQTLREIRGSSFVVAVPDISESLRLLHQHTAFSEITEAAGAMDTTTDAEPQE